MDSAGVVTIMHVFQGGSDPGNPVGAPMQASDGNLYGLTGSSKRITSLYRLTPSGDYKVLRVFRSNLSFEGRPVQGPDGLLYFRGYQGGRHGGGIFSSTLDGQVRLIHQFDADKEGYWIGSGLILGPDGKLYGATSVGGPMDAGTIYRISTSGEFEIVAPIDPAKCLYPVAELLAYQGNIYGMCELGGSQGQGSVFRVTTDGTFTTLHNFGRDRDGREPSGGLAPDPVTGALVGTTNDGGRKGEGALFRIAIDGSGYTRLINFDNHGSHPSGTPFLADDGYWYGTTKYGGRAGGGIAYRFRP
jgi:uncharacterized repeat protein (TIGR03803 family)